MTAMNVAQRRNESGSSGVNVGDTERLLSVLGGGALVCLGLTSKSGLAKVLLPLAGGMLVYRGVSGHCQAYSSLGIDTSEPRGARTSIPAGHGVRVDERITIQRPASQLYSFWRKFDQLPRFMQHLKEVRVQDGRRSHWVASGPLGMSAEWDAEVINDTPNEMIAWRSLPGSTVDTAGSVHFTPVGRGTEVRVTLKYDPPGGKAGAWLAWLTGNDAEGQIREDLRRFQHLMESGEGATHGQNSGRVMAQR